ncbi:hypothetical protein HKX48_001933 [Thoreauomyces humboldtii]|nr:hypothetical protein HKX48_001933 [Thoreauomyces humboldtii]
MTVAVAAPSSHLPPLLGMDASIRDDGIGDTCRGGGGGSGGPPHPYARFFMTGQLADALVVLKRDEHDSVGAAAPCPVHRVILAAHSPILEAAFAQEPLIHQPFLIGGDELVERSPSSSVVLGVWGISAPDCPSLRLVLEWCYFAAVSAGALTALNCWSVRLLAQQLQIVGLVRYCDAWMLSLLEAADHDHGGTGTGGSLNDRDWGMLLKGALKSETRDDILARIVDRAAPRSGSDSGNREYVKYRFLRQLVMRDDLSLGPDDVKRVFAVAVDFTKFDIPQLVDAHSDPVLPRAIIAEALMQSLVLRSGPPTNDPSPAAGKTSAGKTGPLTLLHDNPSGPSLPTTNGSADHAKSVHADRMLYGGTPISAVLARLRQSSLEASPPPLQRQTTEFFTPAVGGSEFQVESPFAGDVSAYELAAEYLPDRSSTGESPPKAPVPNARPMFCGQKSSSGLSTAQVSPKRRAESANLHGPLHPPAIAPRPKLESRRSHPVLGLRDRDSPCGPISTSKSASAFEERPSDEDPMLELMEVKRQVQMLMDRQAEAPQNQRVNDHAETDLNNHPVASSMPRPVIPHDVQQTFRPATMPRPPRTEPTQLDLNTLAVKKAGHRLSTPMVLAEVRRRLEGVIDEVAPIPASQNDGVVRDLNTDGEYTPDVPLVPSHPSRTALVAARPPPPRVIHKQISFAECPTFISKKSDESYEDGYDDEPYDGEYEDEGNGEDREYDDDGGSSSTLNDPRIPTTSTLQNTQRNANPSARHSAYDITPLSVSTDRRPPDHHQQQHRSKPKPQGISSTWSASSAMYGPTRGQGARYIQQQQPYHHQHQQQQQPMMMTLQKPLTFVQNQPGSVTNDTIDDYAYLDVPNAAEIPSLGHGHGHGGEHGGRGRVGEMERGGLDRDADRDRERNGDGDRDREGGDGGKGAGKGSFRMLGFHAAGTVARMAKKGKRKGIIDLFKGS